MTIPQQDCLEKVVSKCEVVPEEKCNMVPKERCTLVEGEKAPGQCRMNTKLKCEDRPKQKCGKTVSIILHIELCEVRRNAIKIENLFQYKSP